MTIIEPKMLWFIMFACSCIGIVQPRIAFAWMALGALLCFLIENGTLS